MRRATERSATITVAHPRAEDVRRLLATHLAYAPAQTPPEDAHALDLDGLLDPAVRFFALRAGGELLAIGALERLDDEHGEIKSMHTAGRPGAAGSEGPCSTICSPPPTSWAWRA
jgi:putative acetyltransferase